MKARARACIVCGAISVPGTSRCAAHKPPGWAVRPTDDTPYGGEWKKLRRRVLERDHYVCQLRFAGCVSSATEVDHILQPRFGGTNDLTNLRAVCKSCHAARTSQQSTAARRMKRARRP